MDKLQCLHVPRQPSGVALTVLTAVAAVLTAATLLVTGA